MTHWKAKEVHHMDNRSIQERKSKGNKPNIISTKNYKETFLKQKTNLKLYTERTLHT